MGTVPTSHNSVTGRLGFESQLCYLAAVVTLEFSGFFVFVFLFCKQLLTLFAPDTDTVGNRWQLGGPGPPPSPTHAFS